MGSAFTRVAFKRHTHDVDGRPLPKLDDIKLAPDDPRTWVLHLLEHRKAMSFDDLLAAVWKYNDDFGESREANEHVAIGLVMLLECGLAVVEPING